MKNKILAPSILSSDFSRLNDVIQESVKFGADWIHLDIMDGKFVPNITFGPPIIKKLPKSENIFYDTHLMIEEPGRYIEDFVQAGADLITVHYEATYHLNRVINQIKSYNIKAGVSINPSTPVSVLENIIEYVDLVLIMSVNPGFGGQKFISNSIHKIKQTSQMIQSVNKDIYLQVDGGVTLENVKEIIDAGTDVIVAGSSVYNDPKGIEYSIRKFNELLGK